MSSDDDWFERGISEQREEDGDTDAEADESETEAGESLTEADEPETEADEAVGSDTPDSAADSADTANEIGDPSDGADPRDTAAAGGSDTDAVEAPSAFDTDRSGPEGGPGSPFDESFSDAFNRAPQAPDGAPNEGELDAGNAFSPGDSDDFEMFTDDSQDFSDEALDSNLDRLKLGVEGLDDMILGGIPHRSLMVSIGSAGTGKTTLAMQFLNTALEAGDRGVYITLEESRTRVLDTAEEKGWEFRRYEEEGTLAIVDLDPVEMANSLASIRNDLTRLIDEFGAERLVLDSVSLLEMMYDHPARRRSEVFGFTRALKQAGVTALVTSESSEDDPFASRYGIIEYLADAVFVLRYVRSSSFQETRLAIEIQKVRDANHSRQPKPYDITNDGIDVHQQANLF